MNFLKKYWRYILASILLLVGVALLLVQPAQTYMLQQGVTASLEQSKEITRTEVAENEERTEDVTFKFEEVEPLSLENIVKYQGQGGRYSMGQIAIPDLNMKIPIYKGVSNYVLATGAGTMKENQKMGEGNYALASHNYFGDKTILFSPLVDAKQGMKIYTTDLENIYEYEITSVDIIEPTKVSVIYDQKDKTEITLITCDDLNATNRYCVKGKFVTKYPSKGASQTVLSVFNINWSNVQ
jgi:sortase A